jgi:hypothetical protein
MHILYYYYLVTIDFIVKILIFFENIRNIRGLPSLHCSLHGLSFWYVIVKSSIDIKFNSNNIFTVWIIQQIFKIFLWFLIFTQSTYQLLKCNCRTFFVCFPRYQLDIAFSTSFPYVWYWLIFTEFSNISENSSFIEFFNFYNRLEREQE